MKAILLGRPKKMTDFVNKESGQRIYGKRFYLGVEEYDKDGYTGDSVFIDADMDIFPVLDSAPLLQTELDVFYDRNKKIDKRSVRVLSKKA